jgi:GTP-binding protein
VKVPASFVISAAKPSEFPRPDLPEIAIVGRSNVGKSSLINALVGKDGLARTSRTPGRTRLVNWFRVDDKKKYHLVDLPGYGFAQVNIDMKESWRPLIEAYLSDRESLAGVLLLIDIRRGVSDEELDFVPWLAQRNVPVVVALTKADKLPKNKRQLEVDKIKRELGLKKPPIATSTLDHVGIDMLYRAVLGLLS